MGKAGENTRTAYHLKRLMDKMGMTPEEVAKRYGRGVGYIKQLLHGHSNAGVWTRKKLAKIFNVDESVFLLPPGDEDVSREKVMAVHHPEAAYDIIPNKTKARLRLMDQLNKILDHPDQSLVRAITANLEAFSLVAEVAEELRAMKKRIDELETKNKILEARLKKREGGACAPDTAIGHDLLESDRTDGGPT